MEKEWRNLQQSCRRECDSEAPRAKESNGKALRHLRTGSGASVSGEQNMIAHEHASLSPATLSNGLTSKTGPPYVTAGLLEPVPAVLPASMPATAFRSREFS